MEFEAPIGGECDVTAPIEEPQVVTFRIPFRHVPATERRDEDRETRLTLHVSNVSRDPDAIFDMVPEGYNYGPENARVDGAV